MREQAVRPAKRITVEAFIVLVFGKGNHFLRESHAVNPGVRHIFTIFIEIADFYCP